MYNDLFSIGGLTVHGYGLCIGIGIAAALLLIWRRAEERKFDVQSVNTLFCSFSLPALPERSSFSCLRIGANFAPIRSALSARRALSSTAALCAVSALRISTAGSALSPFCAGWTALFPVRRSRRASGASDAFSPGAASENRRRAFSASLSRRAVWLRRGSRSGRCSSFRRRRFPARRSAAASGKKRRGDGCSPERIFFCTASAGF